MYQEQRVTECLFVKHLHTITHPFRTAHQLVRLIYWSRTFTASQTG